MCPDASRLLRPHPRATLIHACRALAFLSTLLCLWCGGTQPTRAQTAPSPVVEPRPGAMQRASGSVEASQGAALAPAPRAELLRDEQRRLRAVPFELSLPIAMFGVGVGMGVLGFGVLSQEGDDCERQLEEGSCPVNGTRLVGIVMGVSGAVLALVGATLFPSRLGRRLARKRELKRIERELETLGEHARFAPWFGRTGPAYAGGLAASVRF